MSLAGKRTAWTVAWGAVAAGGAALGTGLAWIGRWWPYARVKPLLDVYSNSGGVAFFTPEYYAGVVGRCRLAGVLFLLGGGLVWMARRWLADFAIDSQTRFRPEAGEIREWLAGPERSGAGHRWLFWGVLALGIAIRLPFWGQPVRADEATTFLAFAARPFVLLFADWSAPNNHMLHSALVRLAYLAFGDSEVALRLPAFLAGIAFLPVLYAFGKKFHDPSTGLLLMAYAAVARPFVVYSTMARGYTMLFVFSYLLFLFAGFVVRHPRNRLAWAGATVAGVAGFFTVPTMLYSFAGVWAWMALSGFAETGEGGRWRGRGRLMIFAALVGVGVLLAYAPAFVATDWKVVLKDETLTGGHSWRHVLAVFREWLPGMLGGARLHPAWLDVALWSVGLGGYVARCVAGRRSVPLWGVVWAVALGLPLLLQRTVPYQRIYVVFYPLIYALPLSGWAYGLRALRGPRRTLVATAVLVAVLAAASGWNLLESHPRRQFRTGDHFMAAEATVRYFMAHGGDGDVYVCYMPSAGPLAFYARKHRFAGRIWDLLEDVPRFREGDRCAWIAVNREHPRTRTLYFSLLGQPEFTRRAELACSMDGVEIYRIDRVALDGTRRTWKYPFEKAADAEVRPGRDVDRPPAPEPGAEGP